MKKVKIIFIKRFRLVLLLQIQVLQIQVLIIKIFIYVFVELIARRNGKKIQKFH
jgi:hypothetical protein